MMRTPLRFLVSLLLLPGITLAQTQIGKDLYIQGDPIGQTYEQVVCLSNDGNVLAIGAPTIDGANGEDADTGRVTVYKRQNGEWMPFNNVIYGNSGDWLGLSLSLSSDGRVLAIGSRGEEVNGSKKGEVRVYKDEEGTWVQTGETLKGDSPYGNFGLSISLSNDGTVLAIGDPVSVDLVDGKEVSKSMVQVYTLEQGEWKQMGITLYGNGEDAGSEFFGYSVSLSGDGTLLAVGAYGKDGNHINQGQVKLFRMGFKKLWILEKVFDGDEEHGSFGFAVTFSNDGNVLAISAPYDDDKEGQITNAGQVKVYKKESGIWNQLGGDFYGSTKGERLGIGGLSLSEDGSILVIGSSNSESENQIGEVKVFKRDGTSSWSQINEGNFVSVYGFNSIDLSNDGSILAIASLAANSAIREGKIVKVFNIDDSSLGTDDYLVSSSKIFPNPVEDHFYIKLENSLELKKVNLYNVTGQLVLSTISSRVDVSELPSGLYFAELHINEGKVTKKILVK